MWRARDSALYYFSLYRFAIWTRYYQHGMQYSICRASIEILSSHSIGGDHRIKFTSLSFVHSSMQNGDADRKASSMDRRTSAAKCQRLWGVANKKNLIFYIRVPEVSFSSHEFCHFPEFFFLKSRVRSRDISSQCGRSICDFALTVSRAHAHAFIIACMLTGGKLSIRRELWEIRDRINRPANSTTSPWRRRERETPQIAPAESWRHILTPKHAFPLSVERRTSSSMDDAGRFMTLAFLTHLSRCFFNDKNMLGHLPVAGTCAELFRIREITGFASTSVSLLLERKMQRPRRLVHTFPFEYFRRQSAYLRDNCTGRRYTSIMYCHPLLCFFQALVFSVL